MTPGASKKIKMIKKTNMLFPSKPITDKMSDIAVPIKYCKNQETTIISNPYRLNCRKRPYKSKDKVSIHTRAH